MRSLLLSVAVAMSMLLPGSAQAAVDRSSDAAVLRLYHAMLDRPPDPAGAAYWTKAHRNGLSLHGVVAGMAASPEYSPATNDLDFVGGLYQRVLRRAHDVDGATYWLIQLDNPSIDHADIIVAFVTSPEAAQARPFGSSNE